MPLAYTIDADERLIVITGDYADAGEWRTLLARVMNDERRAPGFAFLRDLREASRPVDAETVVQVMEVVRRFWPYVQPSRAAILTRHDENPAALVAHALADAQQLPVRAFNSHDEAMAWLREGLSPP
ncbi:MAG TPA: hypothetical protein VGJ78_09260 [Vicinamibacterales bacterium]